jgi:NAD(P)-dependent dehydrogenase (short-subunit alcohol dehydrogenase family)
MKVQPLFSLEGRVAVVTGGTGVLGSAMARGLAAAGASVGILGRRREAATQLADDIVRQGGQALALQADVLNRTQLAAANEKVMQQWGRLDILVNAAGGNMPGAVVPPDKTFFDLQIDDFEKVVALNLTGSVLPSQVFADAMARQRKGVIINIGSMASFKPITRVAAIQLPKLPSPTLLRGWPWRWRASMAKASALTPSRPAISSQSKTVRCLPTRTARTLRAARPPSTTHRLPAWGAPKNWWARWYGSAPMQPLS